MWDCDQLTVSLVGVSQGQPGQQVSTSQRPGLETQWVTYLVQLVRCVPGFTDEDDNIPTSDELDASAATLMADADALWTALEDVRTSGVLFRASRGGAIGPLVPVGPQGGMAGHSIRVSWPLV